MQARVWRGETDKGVPLVAYIAVVSPTLDKNDPRQEDFVRELQEVTSSIPESLSQHRATLDPKPPIVLDARHLIDFEDDDGQYDDEEDDFDYEHEGEDWF